MKTTILLTSFFLTVSCTSVSQEQTVAQQDSLTVDTVTTHRIRLLFAGDLMQHQAQIDAAKITGGYDYSDNFTLVKEEIQQADIAIANLEVTFGGKPYRGYPQFSAPDEYLFAIKDAGFDVLTIATNHIWDKGRKGMERTVMMLDSVQMPYAGAYINQQARDSIYPLLIEKNGFRIALLNYTYGINGYEKFNSYSAHTVNIIDKLVIADDIRKARNMKPDAIIACMHWGEEYKSLPNREQISLTDWMLSKGVTHIIGSHPHVLQPMEIRKDSIRNTEHVVVYSLGNFISNMSVRKTDGGAMVKLELSKDSVTRVDKCEYALVWTERPALSRRKNYRLLPVNYPQDSLRQASVIKFTLFRDDSRALLDIHNKGITEYLFREKLSGESLEVQR